MFFKVLCEEGGTVSGDSWLTLVDINTKHSPFVVCAKVDVSKSQEFFKYSSINNNWKKNGFS